MRRLQRLRDLDRRGFSAAELIVVVAIIGIMAAISIPNFISYQQASRLQAGAQELATILTRGRWLAITQSTMVCVTQASGSVQFLTGGCAGAAWTGPGTDGNGWFTLQNGIQVTTTPQVVFNPLGSATTAGSFTIQNTVNNSTMTVTVAPSGRITVEP